MYSELRILEADPELQGLSWQNIEGKDAWTNMKKLLCLVGITIAVMIVFFSGLPANVGVIFAIIALIVATCVAILVLSINSPFDRIGTVVSIVAIAAVAVGAVVVIVATQIVMPAKEKAAWEEQAASQRQEMLSSALQEAGLSAGSVASLFEGCTIELGEYEQDAIESNGKEPIRWLVLETGENRVLLISEKILEMKCYHASHDEKTDWDSSDLQKWLNDTFAQKAGLACFAGQLGCLSEEEANEYFGSDATRVCESTNYVKSWYSEHEVRLDSWWLRSSNKDYSAPYVGFHGNISIDSNSSVRGIRPVLWIDL